MGSFSGICLELGIGIAIGMLAGTTGTHGSARGRMTLLAAVIGLRASASCSSGTADVELAASGRSSASLGAVFACLVVSDVVGGAGRREGSGSGALGFLVSLAALLVVAIAILIAPAVSLLVARRRWLWLGISRRRRASENTPACGRCAKPPAAVRAIIRRADGRQEADPHLRRLAAHGHAACARSRRAALPTFGALIERGVLIADCVSSFPSVTPVACAEMVTGAGADGHWISGMNWYHRLERRYVEYGSSLEASRAFGVFRALYDLVYNMNLAHLNPGVETLFERLDDAGAADRLHAVPDLPRSPSSPGLARRAAAARGRRDPAQVPPPHLGPGAISSTATSTPAARCPASRPRSRAAATATRPAARRSWSRPAASTSCSSPCPTTTTTLTATGRRRASSRSPRRTTASPSWSRQAAASTRFLDEHALILLADHAQTPVHRGLPLAELLGREWSVLQPSEVRAGAGPARGQPDRPRRPRLPAAGRGRASRPRCGARGADRDRGRRARLPAGGRPTAQPWFATSRAPPPARRLGGGRKRGERAALPSRRARSPTCAAGAGRSKATSRRSRRGRGRPAAQRGPTPTRSPASGRRSTLPTPATSSSPWLPATRRSTGAASPTPAAAATARCTPATPSARCSSSAAAPRTRRARPQWTLRDVAPVVLEHFGLR